MKRAFQSRSNSIYKGPVAGGRMWNLRNREQIKWGRLWYKMNPEWEKMPELWSCQRVQASSRELWKILEGFCFVCFCLFLSVLVNRMFGVIVVTGADLGVLYTWLKTVKFGPQLFPWFLHNLSAVFLFSNTWDLLNESSHSYDMPTQTKWAWSEVLQNVHLLKVK